MTESVINYTKANVYDRAVSFIIDHIIITFIWGLSSFLISGSDMLESDFDPTGLRNTMLGTIPFILLLYFCKDLLYGKSPGRWLMGIMVRTEESYQLPSKKQLFIRNLYLVIWPIEYLVLAASEDNKRWGDEKANTVVVYTP
ncbi:RDD family protein [Reichenbachiella ulvae]|uniref:RDD family protein n=1 Tax=Reichenbachiella ulvae TaxID=2980104 RepID=A0ABT3CN02_9BACT|nr:RDD family protein [Reichenbachiella ulvae]MCV9385068.1 RDD family protein [Reichenbachiella ulvae]